MPVEIRRYTENEAHFAAGVVAIGDNFRDEEAVGGTILTFVNDRLGRVDLRSIEETFRKLDFNTFILALPRDEAFAQVRRDDPGVDTSDWKSLLPGDEVDINRPFVVHFCTYGIDQAMEIARRHGFEYDTQENLKNLENCGYAVRRPDRDELRMRNAPLN